MSYDTKSYELAEYFLSDDPSHSDPPAYKIEADSLAHAIQRAIEDWFDDREIRSFEQEILRSLDDITRDMKRTWLLYADRIVGKS